MFALRRAALAALTAASLCSLAPAVSSAAAGRPWQDQSQPSAVRANELLSALTTDQKIDLALGELRAASEPWDTRAQLRRRPGRPPQPGHDRDALGPGAGGDVRPRARAGVRDRRRVRGPRRGLQRVARAPRLISTARRWPVGSRRPRARTRSWPATRRRRSSSALRASTSSRRSSTTPPTTRTSAASASMPSARRQ